MSTLKCSDDLKKLILETCYPIGHIWISMNSTNPKNIVGGEWTQITDKFLYCTNSSKGTGGSTTTGSTTLSINQIPSHTHMGLYDNANGVERLQSYGTGTTHTGYINGMGTTPWNGHFRTGYTGGGKGHTHPQNLPPYMTCYAWYRTA